MNTLVRTGQKTSLWLGVLAWAFFWVTGHGLAEFQPGQLDFAFDPGQGP
jgi:hypothetical protein